MTGGEALIESLKKEGVDVLFGYPGGVVIPIFNIWIQNKPIFGCTVEIVSFQTL